MPGVSDGSEEGGPPPGSAPLAPGGPEGDLPEAAVRRLESSAFSSGLTVPDFAACLELGLQPVALVQGFCVMQWGFYGPGSGFGRGLSPYTGYAGYGGAQTPGAYTETYRCPHGYVSAEHRAWGQNLEQPWVEDAWAQGYGTSYDRMLEEATQHGAHGVIGVVDRVANVADTGTTEFHFLGTAVVVEDGPPPAGGTPWSTYLAGQRLTKSIEAGFMPIEVVAALASVRVWAYCMTEYQMEGTMGWGAPSGPGLVEQVSKAHMAVRQLARKHVRQKLVRRRAPRRPHRRGQPRALAGRRGDRLHAAGQPDAAIQGLRPDRGAAADGATRMSAGWTTSAPVPDVRAEMLRGAQSLAVPAPPAKTRGITSDLSVDEALLLHAAGWEPLDLVCGVAVVSVPVGVWNWGQGAVGLASDAHNAAVDQAARVLRGECSQVHGHGVVGVRVEVTVRTYHIDVELVGTAVRPVDGADPRGKDAAEAMPFVSDLSARDFTLLLRAGWMPVGLAFGASFVYAPRRTAGAAMRQSTQNVELTNYTEAMYSARESAMERMQRSALEAGGEGVVQVKVTEGPMSFARHAVGFTAWGTAVKLVAEQHQFVRPEVVLPLDDAIVTFEAESLRSAGQKAN